MITIDKEPIDGSYYGIYTRDNSTFQYRFCIDKNKVIRWYHGIVQKDLLIEVQKQILEEYEKQGVIL